MTVRRARFRAGVVIPRCARHGQTRWLARCDPRKRRRRNTAPLPLAARSSRAGTLLRPQATDRRQVHCMQRPLFPALSSPVRSDVSTLNCGITSSRVLNGLTLPLTKEMFEFLIGLLGISLRDRSRRRRRSRTLGVGAGCRTRSRGLWFSQPIIAHTSASMNSRREITVRSCAENRA
jgi:hypothetical protein